MRHLNGIVPGALLLCLACAAPDQGDLGSLPELVPLAPLDWSGVPPSFVQVRGLELGPSEAEALPGDRLLYRIHLQDGSRSRDWLVLAELAGRTERSATLRMTQDGDALEESCPLWKCSMSVFETGQQDLEQTSLALPELCMQLNLFDAARAFEEVDADAPKPDRRMLGMISAIAMFQGWQENEALNDILREVVSPPSLTRALRFLLDPRFTLSPLLDQAEAREVVLAGRSVPVARIPLTLSIGGSVVMRFEVDVAPCSPPLSLGMGVLMMRGVSQSQADRQVRVELIGGRVATAATSQPNR
ncbi:MAG TPA: hypothetical protein QF764_01875 [Planctomycetota bacterium]|nr:hypothetical protein [Planctomycetota bacterium]